MPTTVTDAATRLDREEGFTLVELLVVILLLSIVGGYVLTSVITGMRTGREGQDRVYAIAELQRGAEEIARELRVADPATGGDPFISFSGNDVLVDVRRDMDGDGTPDTVRHRFAVSGGDLRHCQQTYTPPGTPCTGTITGRTVVTDLDTTAPVFTLIDRDGADATSIDDATGVRILLVRQTLDGSDAVVETTVTLRNK